MVSKIFPKDVVPFQQSFCEISVSLKDFGVDTALSSSIHKLRFDLTRKKLRAVCELNSHTSSILSMDHDAIESISIIWHNANDTETVEWQITECKTYCTMAVDISSDKPTEITFLVEYKFLMV